MQRERESDAGIGRGRRAGGRTAFTFESNSQLTRVVIIRFVNETVTYYKFAKSSNVRENGVYRRQLDERSRIYFDTTVRDGPSSLPASGTSCTISFDAINGLRCSVR